MYAVNGYVPLLPGLRQRRLEAGLSQAELQQRSTVAKLTISQLEQGKRAARVSTARKLAQALGCEIRDLMRRGS